MTNLLKLYIMIIRKESRRVFTYRGNIFAGLISAVFTLAVRYALWAALFAVGHTGDATLRETITYFVMMDILTIWLAATYSEIIGSDIRSGDISQKLIKPCSYHLQMVATFHAKALTSTITRSLPMLLIALVFIGLQPPLSPVVFGVFIVTVLLGAVIYSLIDLIISYTVFWLTDYWYVHWFRDALFMLFGGSVLPLWFYPDWLQQISGLLPFKFATFQPLGIYLGRIPSEQFLFTIGVQLVWIAVLFLIERMIWRQAQKKLVVQGG